MRDILSITLLLARACMSLSVLLSLSLSLSSCFEKISPATRLLRNSALLLLFPASRQGGGEGGGNNRSFLRYSRARRIRLSGRFVNGAVSRNKQKCTRHTLARAPFAPPAIGTRSLVSLLPSPPPCPLRFRSYPRASTFAFCYIDHSST